VFSQTLTVQRGQNPPTKQYKHKLFHFISFQWHNCTIRCHCGAVLHFTRKQSPLPTGQTLQADDDDDFFAELPDESAIQARQGMNAPAGTAQQLNNNFQPSAHAQSFSSHRAQDPFAAAAAAAPPAQAHSGAHSAGSYLHLSSIH
jgi:hypothetical protein